MTIRLGLYEAAWREVGPRIEALGLDLDVRPLGADGMYRIGGVPTAPEKTDLDMFWLSAHAFEARDAVFAALRATNYIKVLQTLNAGLDNPLYKELAGRGVRICNSSAQGIAIAEYVLGQVMAVLQPIERQRKLQAARKWEVTPFREISRTRWLIVGFGPIGREVAIRVRAFGGRVDVVRRAPVPDPLADRVAGTEALAEMAAEADVIVVACSLTEATRGLISRDVMLAAKLGAILVNVARGPVVDAGALLEALAEGRIGEAILDVFAEEPLPPEHPFWTHSQIRITAHTSFNGDGVEERWEALFFGNLRALAVGAPLEREVAPASI